MSQHLSSKAQLSFTDVHREAVTTSILEALKNLLVRRKCAPEELTACVFSAASSTDVDLRQVLNRCGDVTLVGRDAETLPQGVALQGLSQCERLHLVGGFDVSGIRAELDRVTLSGLSPRSDLSGLIEMAQLHRWQSLPQQVDFSASVCVLSQLISQVVEALGEHHDQFVPLIQAVRRRHLQLLLDQIKPSGLGLLVFDFVSSDSISALPSLEGEGLERTLAAAIEAGNFFHGLNPQVILHFFQHELQDQISVFQFSKPWVWKTPEITYAVTAVMFQKK